MTAHQGPTGPNGPPGPFLNRTERTRRTQALIDAAFSAPTLAERRDRLTELAALNLDLVSAVTLATARRYRGTPLDRDALLCHVTSVYTESILALDAPLDRDFVIWVTPVIRCAIVDFVRLLPAAS